MNEGRRKKLGDAMKALSEAQSIVDQVKDDEQEAFDNLPENMQSGDKGTTMEQTIETLEEISSNLGDAISELENV